MSYLIDDVARTLASPVPRRKALRVIAGMIAGVFMATIGAQRASADTCNTGTCKTGCVVVPYVFGEPYRQRQENSWPISKVSSMCWAKPMPGFGRPCDCSSAGRLKRPRRLPPELCYQRMDF